jgi:hypothetical protein
VTAQTAVEGLVAFIAGLAEPAVARFTPLVGPVLAPQKRAGATDGCFLLVSDDAGSGAVEGAADGKRALRAEVELWLLWPVEEGLGTADGRGLGWACHDAVWSALLAVPYPNGRTYPTGDGRCRVQAGYTWRRLLSKPPWAGGRWHHCLLVAHTVEAL